MLKLTRGPVVLVLLPFIALSCADKGADDATPRYSTATVVQTSRGGDKLAEIATLEFAKMSGADHAGTDGTVITLDPTAEYQTILGFHWARAYLEESLRVDGVERFPRRIGARLRKAQTSIQIRRTMERRLDELGLEIRVCHGGSIGDS